MTRGADSHHVFMRVSTRIHALAGAVAVLLLLGWTTPARAQIATKGQGPVLVEITGATQGKIDGNVNVPGFENLILGYGFSVGLRGAAGTAPAIQYLTLLKPVDPASPKLVQAAATAEPLTVTARFYALGSGGVLTNYFTIVLQNAQIESIGLDAPSTLDPSAANLAHAESVQFIAPSVQFRDEIGGTITTFP